MSKAYEVMTKSLATCSPDENATHVANIMKERDIGNVLVVEDGKLRGIVTDRDLVINALTSNSDVLQSPISKYMSTDIVTGDAGWSIDKVAKIMAKNQIRRLPIVEGSEVVGIISLGDIARHYTRKNVVSNLLKDISTPNSIMGGKQNGGLGKLLGLSIVGLSAAMMTWLTWSHTGQELRKQMIKSKPYQTATQAVNIAREKVNDAATSKQAINLRRQVKSNLKELSAQLPTIHYKPHQKRRAWFT